MFGWRFCFGLSCLALVAACGGEAGYDPRAGTGAAGAGGASAVAGAPSSGGAAGTSATGVTSAGGRATPPDELPFVDPGCPNEPAPPGIVECDPLAATSGCLPGEACYPYVDHPFGKGCDAESFGALCQPAGSGTDGSLCGDGSEGCANGYVCVIGARAGRRCAKLCRIDQVDLCSNGTICEDTDVQGYGVCN
jgi:hypothetical protein